MKINIYYGGRGLIGDPTLYVISKMQEVLHELNVAVERYDLYELKQNITTLPQTLKDADGVILATTVEWYGIGGYMQQFLDSCWLYGDKEKISSLYMCPIVMSTTYGEREGKLNLSVAWEILGGRPCSGICGYIPEISILEMNDEYTPLIEKKAESMYRTINQKLVSLPASNQAVKQKVSVTQNIDLTPHESEQLSEYAADESYVQKQKEDIQELTSIFKDMLGNKHGEGPLEKYVKEFQEQFKPQPGFRAIYRMNINSQSQPLVIDVNVKECRVFYGGCENPDVQVDIMSDILEEILAGRMTFQRAFMAGHMKMKGDFKALRTLDIIFQFAKPV